MKFCPDCGTKFDIAKLSEKFLKQKGGSSTYGKIINKIINNDPDDEIRTLIQTIKVDELLRHSSFKKLTNTNKEITYNKIQDLLPTNKKKISKKKPIKKEKLFERFICNNCGFVEQIEEGTIIYKKRATTKKQYVSGNFKNMKYSKILPYTRKYICPNSKCPSLTDPKKREAKFFRPSGSYEIIYHCLACGEMF